MDYLRKALGKTLVSIKKRKMLFALLLFLQIIFLALSLYTSTHYLIQILEDTQGIIQPLENANYDSQSIEQGDPFTPDYLSIYNSYQSMLRTILTFSGWMILLFLTINGSIWLWSHWLLQEKKDWKSRMKEAARFFLKAGSSALLLVGSFAVISYFVLLHYVSISDSFTKLALALKLLLIALLVVYYFLLSALALASTGSWRNFVKNWIKISFLTFSKTMVLFFTLVAILSASFLILYVAIEFGESVLLLLITGAINVLALVLVRIFWIAGIEEIQHEAHHH